jgi:hypothetical protein
LLSTAYQATIKPSFVVFTTDYTFTLAHYGRGFEAKCVAISGWEGDLAVTEKCKEI